MIHPLWYYWAILLAQNWAFTEVSRARNSSSLWRHWKASQLTNGIWFISQTVIFNQLTNIMTGRYGIKMSVFVWLYYITFTSAGALWGHRQALKKESGKNAVGHNAKYAQIPVAEWEAAKSTLDELRSMNGIV